jgi:hypothetical protein
MKSKDVSSLVTITGSELKALLKLVQIVTHDTQFKSINRDTWILYCCQAFGWTLESAEFTIDKLRRMATNELGKHTDD